MLTVADMGGGGVKNGQKSADVLYGRSLRGPATDRGRHLMAQVLYIEKLVVFDQL